MHIARRLSGAHDIDASTGHRHGAAVGVAVIGVALAVVVLEWTLGVVTGFRAEITQKVMSSQPPVVVQPAYDYTTGRQAPWVSSTPNLEQLIQSVMPGAHTALGLTHPMVLKTRDDFYAVVAQASQLAPSIMVDEVVAGTLPLWPDSAQINDIVISSDVARRLGLAVGDKVDACLFVSEGVKVRRPRVAAIVDTRLGNHDKALIYTSMSWLQEAAGIGNGQGTYIGVYPPPGHDDYARQAADLQTAIITAASQGALDEVYPVDNVMHTGQMYFSWLGLLDTNVRVIFILMLCLGAFTLISAMFILILERVATIGLLRSLGMTVGGVSRIFVWMAQRLVLKGLIWGNAIGLVTLLVQQWTRVLPLDAAMYYVSWVPVKIVWWQIAALNLGVLVMAWMVLILPARIVAKVSPAATMRFE